MKPPLPPRVVNCGRAPAATGSGDRRFHRFHALAGHGALHQQHRLLVPQPFEDRRRVALLKRQVTHAIGFATEQLREAFINSRRADDA